MFCFIYNHYYGCFIFIYLQLFIVSDYLNDSFHDDKLFEKELIKEGMGIILYRTWENFGGVEYWQMHGLIQTNWRIKYWLMNCLYSCN